MYTAHQQDVECLPLHLHTGIMTSLLISLGELQLWSSTHKLTIFTVLMVK